MHVNILQILTLQGTGTWHVVIKSRYLINNIIVFLLKGNIEYLLKMMYLILQILGNNLILKQFIVTG